MQQKVRVLIVEDEFVTLDILQHYLEESGYEVSGDAMTAEEAIGILERGDTDIAILDINIKGEKDGVWLAGQIREHYRLPFIFLTAFSDRETVGRAAETHPYGYLVKPFSQADIFSAIEVALKNYAEQMEAIKLPEEHTRVSTELLINDSIFVKDNLVFKKIALKEIRFVQAYKNYLELNLGESRHVIRSTLADFQKILPKEGFVQTHRSYVVNLHYLNQVGGTFITIGKLDIPVSKTFKDELVKRLKFYY